MPSPGSLCPCLSKRLFYLTVASTLLWTVGCGSGTDAASGARLAVSPSTSMVNIGHDVSLVGTGAFPNETCSWSSSDEDVLSSIGNGVFHARDGGTASVSMTCGAATSTALVAVAKPLAVAPAPIVITAGGTYSGVWNSNDPKTPAVSIRTNAPVIIQNSTITSVGDLINIKGASPTSGANVTIQNVTATALDPGVAGKERGAFVTATNITGLIVTNCTVTGASFGVAAYYSTMNVLHIQNNIFNHLEDRASDGNGGFRTRIPAYGHMVILDDVIAPNGADISWNQLLNTIGSDSTEDGVNIYKSAGTAANPIRAHDNYLEGYASPAQGNQYSGSGLITDGDSALPVSAYVVFDSNEIVHTAGTGIALANGHDQQATNNRIVSCGQDASGNWFATNFANAVIVTNYYGAPQFTNHIVSGSLGGMVRPNANSQPIPVDFWSDSLSPGDNVANNGFTNPCLVNGKMWLTAESNERAFWAAKLTAKSVVMGAHH